MNCRGLLILTFFAASAVAQPPSAPTILSPLTGRDSLPVTFTVTWDTVEHAESYRIFVQKDGKTIIGADDLVGYTYQVTSLDSATTYQLLVQGVNQAGYGTPAAMVFTTVGNISIPSPVELIYPADASNPPIENSMPPFVITLQWQSQNPIKNYHLQVAVDPEFDSLVWNDSMLHTAEEYFPPDYKQCYWWRVRARNTAGWGAWSTAWSFCHADQGTVFAHPGDWVRLIPNPAANSVTVLSHSTRTFNTHCFITDALGRTVHTESNTFRTGSLTVDVSNLPNGVYYLRVGFIQTSIKLLIDR